MTAHREPPSWIFVDPHQSTSVAGARVCWFLDFETMGTALPFFADLRPYESFVYQYSLHGLLLDDHDAIRAHTHADWIFTPSAEGQSVALLDRELLSSLRSHLQGAEVDGDRLRCDAIYHWAPHERIMLASLRTRLARSETPELDADMGFIDSMMGTESTPATFPLDDLCHRFQQSVSHPDFAGSYSIKKVFPVAVRSGVGASMFRRLMPELAATCGPGESPYDALFRLARPGMVIQDGIDAVGAYGEILQSPESERASESVDALRRYCALDTAAMVVAWKWFSTLIA